MDEPDGRIGGQTEIDRLADAAQRILGGASIEEVARELGCPLSDIRALADQLSAAGLGRPGDQAVRVQWAPWFPSLLRGLFARRHPEPAGSLAAESWSDWQPLRSARDLEVRTRSIADAVAGAPASLWAYELRSLSLFTVNFRYWISTEGGDGLSRRVRGLRPGEFYGGTTAVPSARAPEIDAELIEPVPEWPESSTAAGP